LALAGSVWAAALWLSLGGACAAGELVVRLPRAEAGNELRHAYFCDVLKLALDATSASDGPYRLEQTTETMVFAMRGVRCLKLGEDVDVLWLMSSSELERDLLPVRVPLLKGLAGCRALLVRRADLPQFAAITDLKGLQRFVAGEGEGLPEVATLQANGLKVEQGKAGCSLFEMLGRRRFDFMPCCICEAWGALQAHPDEELAIEPHLLIHYPAAIYFFVNPQASALADRLERGLKAALADGTFDACFLRHHGESLRHLQLANRTVLELAPGETAAAVEPAMKADWLLQLARQVQDNVQP